MKVVAFDVYGTLIDIELDENRPEAYAVLSQWLAYHGLTVSPEQLHEQYLAYCHEQISAVASANPDIEIGRVFAAIMLAAGGPTFQVEQHFIDNFAVLFRMLTTVRLSLYPGVLPMLETLRAKTRLGIVSNAQRLFTIPELKRFGLLPFFQSIVLSSDTNVCKPSPEIFQSFLKSAGVTPRDVIYVGDNIWDDVYGAKRLGMTTIWLNRNRTVPGSGGMRPDLELDGLSYDCLTQHIVHILEL
jgi:putative hydrolase of the HAD superfamily